MSDNLVTLAQPVVTFIGGSVQPLGYIEFDSVEAANAALDDYAYSLNSDTDVASWERDVISVPDDDPRVIAAREPDPFEALLARLMGSADDDSDF
jgi:hypothetical protein